VVIAGDSGSYTQAQANSAAIIAKYLAVPNVGGHGELSTNREDVEGTAIAANVRQQLGLAKNWIDINHSGKSKAGKPYDPIDDKSYNAANSLNLNSQGKVDTSTATLKTKTDADNSINKYLQETGLGYKQLSPSDLQKWNEIANQYNKNLIFDNNDPLGSWNRIGQAWVNQESGYKNTSKDSNIANTAGTVNQAIGLTQSSPGQVSALGLGAANAATAARLQNDSDFNIKVGFNLLNNQFDKGGIFGTDGLKKVSGSFSPSYDGKETQFTGQNLLAHMMTNANTLPDKDRLLNTGGGQTTASKGSSGNTETIAVKVKPFDVIAQNISYNTGVGSPNGFFSKPVVGAKVWVFFHGGDIQRPVYFASVLERHSVAAAYNS